ncbi:DUF2513 domain-containing protein [Planctomyces sp. SH-PL14]|uniref:DUF2513 domain-containing protein n=1 Tax=Planctomyces sp. SH-PL14 TaxID=1632864 RepID=UPI00078B8F99|nr:DUF2513 domain-containing protein [Planctomyces sp. SH-PL14]AMV19104.1 hypothetical protein VT03_14535 [Planctomyces sp. SH-PL14]
MKRDLAVVRGLLIEIEEIPSDGSFGYDQSKQGLSRPDFDEYVRLLEMEGFVHGVIGTLEYGSAQCEGLTPRGHDYLDKVRSETIWNAVVEKAKASGVALTISAAYALAKVTIEEKLGIKL